MLLAVHSGDDGLKWLPGLIHIPRNVSMPATFNTRTGACSWLDLSAKADLSGATFTGDVNASRIQVNGSSANGLIRLSPAVSGGEASVSFFRNQDRSVSALSPGDAWYIGHNVYTSGPGSFTIGCNNTDAVLTIQPTGLVTIPNGLTVNGPILSSTGEIRPWVLARINNAAASISFQNGSRTAEAVQVAGQVGQYQLTWPTTNLATSYIQLTAAAAVGQQRFVQYVNFSPTGCLIHIYDRNGTPQWTDVNIRVDVAG
jgi:hypothetical protein